MHFLQISKVFQYSFSGCTKNIMVHFKRTMFSCPNVHVHYCTVVCTSVSVHCIVCTMLFLVSRAYYHSNLNVPQTSNGPNRYMYHVLYSSKTVQIHKECICLRIIPHPHKCWVILLFSLPTVTIIPPKPLSPLPEGPLSAHTSLY